MQKRLYILSVIIIMVTVVSCRKDDTGMKEPVRHSTELTASGSSQANRNVVDPLTVGLEAWYKFDNNLKDAAGKSPEGIPTTRGVSYSMDRKGNSKSAIYFDNKYGVKLPKIKQQTNTSLSVWVKYADQDGINTIIRPSLYGPFLISDKTGGGWGFPVEYHCYGGVRLNGDVSSYVDVVFSYSYVWHHFVVTYDGTIMKFYGNGNLVASKSYAGTINQALAEYFLGYDPGDNSALWNGWMDELRFYSRTLSPTDVQKLYNQ
ncbi:MAG TPA: LamG domain-containing protein [Chitinophagaceae bacterium]